MFLSDNEVGKNQNERASRHGKVECPGMTCEIDCLIHIINRKFCEKNSI